MKTLKELLIELNACNEAKVFVSNKNIEDAVKDVKRGDWLLWLAKKIEIPIKPLTLAKTRCAKTVIHLMKDQRSIDAVNIAEKYGLTDEISDNDLKNAADAAAYAAAYAAADAAKRKNQVQTADICREILGELIINRVNELLQ